MKFIEKEQRLAEIFMLHAMERKHSIEKNKTRFVHYTTAEAAMSLLQNREVWMRNTSCMDDYMEVEHGLECLFKAYKSETGKKFKEALEAVFVGISADIEDLFSSWIPDITTDTYIMCVSEHDDIEDRIGRLSMWRAYGETTGVALVLNNAVFLSRSNALKAYTSPVAYLSEGEFDDELKRVALSIENNVEFLREQDRNIVQAFVFHMMKFAAICTKHPGFQEEREWRVIYSPTQEKSDRLIKEIRLIRGTPQSIYKIPLQNIPEEKFVGVEISELIDRVIIGPTQYPIAMSAAFEELLESSGVEDPMSRVFVSDIPLR